MKYLYQQVDIASLAFFRIAFGILGFADVLNTYIYYHLTIDAFNPAKFQFRYYGFEWLPSLPSPSMDLLFMIVMLAGIGIALGFFYRLSTIVFAVGFTYFFLLEKSFYLNHAYLMIWISFAMILIPADREWSLKSYFKPYYQRTSVPYWNLFIFQFLMGVVYCYGGIAKINPDWLQGIPMIYWMEAKSDLPIIGPILAIPATGYFMSISGLFIDLLAAPLLLFKRTRLLMFTILVLFHFINHLVFNIGIFPFLSLSLTALFFPPSWPRRFTPLFTKRAIIFDPSKQSPITTRSGKPLLRNPSPLFSYIFLLFIGFHLLIPFRHYLFPGPVVWTEEGHRYSWRMMLRSKYGSGQFIVVDKATKEKTNIIPHQHLDKKQTRKLFAHPDMILQFAHHLEDTYLQEGKEVEVYADIKIRLNGRKSQRYIDPTVDLTTVSWHFFKSSPWISDFKDE